MFRICFDGRTWCDFCFGGCKLLIAVVCPTGLLGSLRMDNEPKQKCNSQNGATKTVARSKSVYGVLC